MILVLGQPRTGTSLAMQMIHAAGVKCLGEWPGFETDNTLRIEDGEAGKVLVISGEVPRIPPTARVVVTSRDSRQQALSERKFLALTFRSVGSLSRSELRRAIRSYEKTQSALVRATYALQRCCFLRFENVLARPGAAAAAIAGVIGAGPDVVERMAAVVRPRAPECYPGMLEVELLEEAGHAI